MLVKIFVQDICPNCPPSKELGKKLQEKGINVEFHNVKTPEGLSESLMHNVMSTPSTIIVKEDKVVDSHLGKTPSMEEVMKWS